MNHLWDKEKQACDKCGINYSDYVNDMAWGYLFCQADVTTAPRTDDCCFMPAPVYLGGSWFCETCGTKNEKLNKENKVTTKKCTCGYAAIGVNNFHSDWCDAK